ncbi:MAG: DUF2330 domain-containing protein [Thermosynechococcaceae cyanobacterium]
MKQWRVLWCSVCVALLILGWAVPAWAFCGFYVAKADTKLFNQASQVAIARDGQRTVITMANDFKGAVSDFAMVVPVPVVLQKEQVHIGNPKILERLDEFSAPRLVEYYDENPCPPPIPPGSSAGADGGAIPPKPIPALGGDYENKVTVEAQFDVGEYSIVILSAKESDSLETWLIQNGYKIPMGSAALFRPYVRQDMKFFVAKVNLKAFEKSGFQTLRPIQMAYESPKFMLPIRLGMINAAQAQDLVIYLLSPKGQGEVTNYRTVNVPSDAKVPLFVNQEFDQVYPALFETAYQQEGRNVVFREYAWNMANCDPCSASPLNSAELKEAGVFWYEEPDGSGYLPPWANQTVFITRLHARYTRDKFPEDLMFQETANQQTFQGRYILTHPFEGDLSCPAGRQYKRSLPARYENEAQTLAQLTGWKIETIRQKMNLKPPAEPWWRRLWQE